MAIERGDVVVVAARGANTGKPRPALVVQSDLHNEVHPSLTVCPITSKLVDAPLFRTTVEPSDANGLKTTSQVMVDKVVTVPRTSIRERIGQLDAPDLTRVEASLRYWLGLG